MKKLKFSNYTLLIYFIYVREVKKFMKNEEKIEFLKATPHEMGGNGINPTVEEINIEDFLKEIATA